MLGYKALSKLNQKKYRQQYQCFLVEGSKNVLEALAQKAEITQLVVETNFPKHHSEIWQRSEVQKFVRENKVVRLSAKEFNQVVTTTTPQGIVGVVSLPKIGLTDLFSAQTIAVLEDVRDPGNLGTMIRTADWFGVGGLLLIGGADPYQPKVVRSSMGSIFNIPIVQKTQLASTLKDLKQQDFEIVVTKPSNASLKPNESIQKSKYCIIFGNEAHGVSKQAEELADQSLSIPKYGQAESLNVAVSFGIVLYALQQQQ